MKKFIKAALRHHDFFSTRCGRALRPLRRPLRSRSADVAARRTGADIRGGEARSGVSGGTRRPADELRRAGPRRSITRKRLSEQLGGAKIYIKREDLLHTGAHKINNCLGQALLARRMGKKRIIAETGAGQHGVATATVCALFGFDCTVYMGEEDMRRQRLNVFRMRLLGAKVVPVTNGSRTLKDAISEAMRDWVTNVATTHYLLGSALGAHPYPAMVRDFHRVIGVEAREQILRGRRPAAGCGDCLRGRRQQRDRHLPSVHRGRRREADRRGSRRARARSWASMRRALPAARPGVLQGTRSYLLQDDDGQIALTHSVSAGLDYASVGPEHAWLHDRGRAEYCSCYDDADAIAAARHAEPHGRHYSGARIGARRGRSHPAGARASGRRSSSSTSPAAATRTSTSIAKI